MIFPDQIGDPGGANDLTVGAIERREDNFAIGIRDRVA